ncbi:sodium-dependent proline transporter-like isoform X2 [Paramacrobiotus metropolitanus]|uniref:sodium-dependent proline transporter-like isoform X2 n=1 Tax=Paramacrobiotus metropolitanus TaxID=2943436 RepID=UPI002445630B|nr:sodium-dependent proline transporter-like isoform X2 [Paramacrobiotus metropolitanus]
MEQPLGILLILLGLCYRFGRCKKFVNGLFYLWRFPYLAYLFGGGSFLLAYFIILVLMGIPMILLEIALGQYTGTGPVKIFQRLSPFFGGLGYAIIANQFLICTYYAMILAWAFFYLFASFTNDLPWTHCGSTYSGPFCHSTNDAINCWKLGGVYQARCYSPMLAQQMNLSPIPPSLKTTSSEEYFNRYVLRISESISNPESPDWRLALCLLLAWIVAFLCISKGVHSIGKAVWVTTIFPFVILIILTIHGGTLDNAVSGIWHFITPNWKRLLSVKLWVQAASQVFFSLSVGGGGLITYSSYNTFRHNFYFDGIIISLFNGITSLLAGFAVFSALGFMAGQMGVSVGSIVKEGPGLTFIAYPDAISRMPVPTLWAILFNFMILCLGLDTLFAIIETIATGICDHWPKFTKRRVWVIMAICCAGFAVGLLYTTRAGIYWVQLVDDFVAGWPLIFFGFCEIVIILLYGVNKFSDLIYSMTGHHVNWIYKTAWWSVIPLCTLGLIVADWIYYEPTKYNGVRLPLWTQVIGWMLALGPVMLIPLHAAYEIYNNRKLSFCAILKTLFTPTSRFQPQSASVEVLYSQILVSPESINPLLPRIYPADVHAESRV